MCMYVYIHVVYIYIWAQMVKFRKKLLPVYNIYKMDWVRWSNLIKINFTFNWILNSYSSNIQISTSWFYLFEHRTNQKPISPHKLRVNIVCLWVLRISTKKIKLVRQINLLDLFFFLLIRNVLENNQFKILSK